MLLLSAERGHSGSQERLSDFDPNPATDQPDAGRSMGRISAGVQEHVRS